MKGILLLNLGTPDAPTPKEVKVYLREFLMDPLVIDIPFPLRWFLVNGVILRTRPKASAALYQKIWTDKGSPLLLHTQELAKKLQRLVGEKVQVAFAMRYGKPSIETAMQALRQMGVTDLSLLPLYPQYSLAATKSSIKEAKKHWDGLNVLPAFYDQSWYLDAVAKVSAPVLKAREYDHVLFSYHGLPERQVKKLHSVCLSSPHCCNAITEDNKDCYRAQCYATSRELAKRLGLENYSVAFQSRLGGTPWIRPYSDYLYEEFPQKGIKKLAVLCPSFVADCLETLEEVQIRGLDQFRQAGGEDLFLVPSLNSSDVWAEALAGQFS